MKMFEEDDLGKQVLIEFNFERIQPGIGILVCFTSGKILEIGDHKATIETTIVDGSTAIRYRRRIGYELIKSYQFI